MDPLKRRLTPRRLSPLNRTISNSKFYEPVDSPTLYDIRITDINNKKHYGYWDGKTPNDRISLRDKYNIPLNDIKQIVFIRSSDMHKKDVLGGKRRKTRRRP
jgi:hypothetical protein